MDCLNSTQDVPTIGAAGSPLGCRWNPTKEQIEMLENLYAQGLRTPAADQIQEITTRLQTYGHIEGKNVFYWFQNHKARQRQKEKQDHISLFRQYNHLLHRPPPQFIHIPPTQNVMYEPCYMPQNNLGFYAYHPQAVSPTTSSNGSGIKRRSPRTTNQRLINNFSGFLSTNQPESVGNASGNHLNIDEGEIINVNHHQETLDLFPVHPTGILKKRLDTTGNATCLLTNALTTTGSTAVDRMYFDFFC